MVAFRGPGGIFLTEMPGVHFYFYTIFGERLLKLFYIRGLL